MVSVAKRTGSGIEEGAENLRNRKGQVEAAIEADPIGEAVCQLVEKEDWLGSPTELLACLKAQPCVSEAVRKGRTWPAIHKLRGRLRWLASPLRERGITPDLDDRANDAARTRSHRPPPRPCRQIGEVHVELLRLKPEPACHSKGKWIILRLCPRA